MFVDVFSVVERDENYRPVFDGNAYTVAAADLDTVVVPIPATLRFLTFLMSPRNELLKSVFILRALSSPRRVRRFRCSCLRRLARPSTHLR